MLGLPCVKFACPQSELCVFKVIKLDVQIIKTCFCRPGHTYKAFSHMIFNKDVILKYYTQHLLIDTHQYINTQFTVSICVSSHYVLQYIDASQYCPISGSNNDSLF